jgi:hypothetical protein
MVREENTRVENIKEVVENITITPYQEVKNNLDSISRKTRKALGVKLHCQKPLAVIYNEPKNN